MTVTTNKETRLEINPLSEPLGIVTDSAQERMIGL
jgi:hypothetical protein